MADRKSRVLKPVSGSAIPTDPVDIARVEERNALLQFDAMVALIDRGLSSSRFNLGVDDIRELNRVAVQGTLVNPGELRQVAVEIDGSVHDPPDWKAVPALVDKMIAYVNDHWEKQTAIHLSAYLMWRLNWIHPFENGNGRTSRAIAYAVLCIKLGYHLPGTPTVPEQIARDKRPYYMALDAADDEWKSGKVGVGQMEKLLTGLLCVQLACLVEEASGENLLPPN